MKTCTVCNQTKPESEFSWKNKAQGKLSSSCKACHKIARRKHHELNRQKNIQKAIDRRQSIRDKIWEYRNTHPCVDCDFADPRTLQFDHLPGCDKEFDISQAAQRGFAWNKIQTEIDKCEVVCANCHAIRTHDRGGWVRNTTVEF